MAFRGWGCIPVNQLYQDLALTFPVTKANTSGVIVETP